MKPPADDSAPPLVFDWRAQPSRVPRLIKALLVTLMGMAVFFFLFKVIYPQSQMLAPVPQQITFISPADPSARALLHRVQDRDFAIVPDAGDGMSGVRLEDRAPLFHPTFEKRELQLQDLPHKAYAVPPPRLLDATAPVLPDIDMTELKPPRAMPATEPGRAALTLTFTGGLATRKVTHAPDMSALGLADPEAWRFHIGVDQNGRVSFALPLAVGEQAKLSAAIAGRLGELRFEPRENPGSTVEWSDVTFRWINPSPP